MTHWESLQGCLCVCVWRVTFFKRRNHRLMLHKQPKLGVLL